jgi:hypothetical protein
MEAKEFSTRLRAILEDSKAQQQLQRWDEAEAAHSVAFAKFQGFRLLVCAFDAFIPETVERINTELRPRLQTQLPMIHALFLERLAHFTRSMRASAKLADMGYPLHAYTMLRNVFDGVVLCAAVALGITDFYRLDGLIDQQNFDPNTYRKNRRNEERQARLRMTGKDSGLTAATLELLGKWDIYFDDETHAAALTRMHGTDWLLGQAGLPVLPAYREDNAAMFINRYCEIAWMVHRLLPLIQLKDIQFSRPWKERWQTLDDCFLVSVESLLALGKPIGGAIVEFVQAKFPFHQDTTFWLKTA